MSITKLKFQNAEKTSLQVTTDSGSYSTAWPCYTWHNEEIQAAIDAGMTIEPWKTEAELLAEQKETRKQEILSQLNDIDLQTVRPLRAKVNGTATIFDEEKLTSLETQAATLRAELTTL